MDVLPRFLIDFPKDSMHTFLALLYNARSLLFSYCFWMRVKSTIIRLPEPTKTHQRAYLVLLALNYHRSEVVATLLVVSTVRSVAVWPVLRFPATAEGSLLGDVFDVDHVNHLGLG